MIREVVRTKRMPPWHADPHVGVFEDRPLADAPRKRRSSCTGSRPARRAARVPDTARRAARRQWAEWAFGEPDLVVEVPAFDVPATGIVDYQRYVVPNTTGRDVWVRATDTIPGDRARGASRDRRRLRPERCRSVSA